MKNWIAVTGGCGYIGSHIAAQLKENTDYKVLIIDRAASDMPHTHWTADEIVDADIDSGVSRASLLRIRPVAIIHCAGTSLVGPSIQNPGEYYNNNVIKSIKLMDFMRENHLNNLIFSSSASVYGESFASICSEAQAMKPINPYGSTKAIIEQVMEDYGRAYGLNNMRFRYFNAAGADPKSRLGQMEGATHLLAKIMENVTRSKELMIYGNIYPTKDGTCVRDYVHVSDIARAHVLAIDYLFNNTGSHVLNLGSGAGTTVLEMVKTTEEVTRNPVKYTIGETRVGDPAILIADSQLANKKLNWMPEYNLQDIVKHAWDWYTGSTYTAIRP